MTDPDVISSLSGRGSRPALVAFATLVDGVPSEVEATIDGDAESLIVLRDGQGVRAWFNVCPHAGRRLDWAPGQFLLSKEGALVCAVHGATFEMAQGECIAGPCRGQSLRTVVLEVRDGEVFLAEKG